MQRPTLIFLPGTLCSPALFDHQIRHLSEIADVRVVDVHRQDTLSAVARWVLEQVDGAFAVAGLSYGGIVAFELWRQAAARISRMALLNTNPLPPSPEMRERQLRFASMARQGEFRRITADFLKDAMLHPDHRGDPALSALVLEMADAIGVEGFLNTVKAQLARPDSTPDLPTITCPTLVLTGREDAVVPLDIQAAMAKALPNSRFVIVERCGHLSALEQPEIVTAALRDWLLGVGIWQG
jgi:pimeloyl-ACP methyl ester carboxylesterase